MGLITYRLALPFGLSGVYLVFHIFMLKRYYKYGYYIIKWNSVLLDKDLTYIEEPVAILDQNV